MFNSTPNKTNNYHFIASRMDSRNSESDSVNGAESILSSSPGAASTSSRERIDSDSSDTR